MISPLSPTETFAQRHIGPSPEEAAQMLKTLGVGSLEELIAQTIPASIRRKEPMKLPEPLSEHALLERLREMAAKNKLYQNFIGMGYYGTHVPGVIQRNILENPGWYTQYTPYQAEIAQGRLEALLNYQTLVSDLTGMDVANASLLDEATAAAEAMTLAYGHTRSQGNGNKIWASATLHPQTLAVLHTRAEPQGIEIVLGEGTTAQLTKEYFAAIAQYPDTQGAIEHWPALAENIHVVGGLFIVAADLLALTLLTPPGEFGADVVVGSAQRFGVPMGYGGPHAAFFATKEAFKRQLPGRLIGVSQDAEGKPGLRLALQTREQHIRREKATSNICTAQVLLAVMASMYAVYHGPKRLKAIARRVHTLTNLVAKVLEQIGIPQANEYYFDTLHIKFTPSEQQTLRQNALGAGINLRYFADGAVGISLDETTEPEDIAELLSLFYPLAHRASALPQDKLDLQAIAETLPATRLEPFERQSSYLTHPVFNSYHTETEMLRYIKRLEAKDLSLAHSMIPLGSCTMKLNATTEMVPVTWPEFGSLHPFVPEDQAEGYHLLFRELTHALAEATGFAGVSLQPNSGAQGEYTGLMVIREYFKQRGEQHRNVALIPNSAHGTNPASAVMAGMEVVVTKADEQGNIDFADLQAKAEQYKDRLAALMVTYPSTHGVFEEQIQQICALIHRHGGQVYIDGANMNAQVGLTHPAILGGDVCHLNLHKTFCIPHGGGGPGMGPICVAKHLVPFLPGHPVVHTGGAHAMGAVSAAPFGSASILLISYAYILLMGEAGLTDATRYAILNGNYIKTKLETAYPILYQGVHNRVAHELILDLRPFKKAGIEVEDVAKRLIDYGYHAPTVSFPVPGTLMIEPTESESKAELDRFITAMLGIREEIEAVVMGKADAADNVLKHAPHTLSVITADAWAHAYTRQQAAYPVPYVQERKFWPAVARINNTYGDRNLICSCPPMEAYEVETATLAEATY